MPDALYLVSMTLAKMAFSIHVYGQGGGHLGHVIKSFEQTIAPLSQRGSTYILTLTETAVPEETALTTNSE